ncbi:hypothetical protein C6361_28035 [Plantactinospora sp. BC1]|nr:hypothetical protein C6361_28035 [Plantactinospora sp. BC1]
MVDGLPAAAQPPESEEPEPEEPKASEEWEIPLPVWIGEEHVRFAVRALVLHVSDDEPTGPRCLWDAHPHPCRLARWGRRVLAARGFSRRGHRCRGATGRPLHRPDHPHRRGVNPMSDYGRRARRTPAEARPSGTLYGGGVHPPPIPGQIRTATFPLTPFGRRGYRPSEVRLFLTALAETLTALQDELAMVRTENERLKVHLRQWQSRNSSGRHRAERR